MSNSRSPFRLRLWPGLVFLLIGANFAVVGITVYAAGMRRGSFVVESEYDRKALHWEQTARQNRHSSTLGWNVQIASTDHGRACIALTDRLQRPLEAASIRMEAFHHAHARSKIHATLTPTAPGIYAANAAINLPGLWEFRFTVIRGPETFTQSLTHTVGRAGPEQPS